MRRRGRRGRGGAWAGLFAGLGLACSGAEAPLDAASGLAPPPAPRACAPVEPGELGRALARATPGSALCLTPGEHAGPISIPAGVTLYGPRSARIRSSGVGTTVRIEADGATLVGVTVDGSGGRFDRLDAAVRVEGENVRVAFVDVVNATFGILVERSRRVVLRGNRVTGDAAKPLGLRGDGIRLWETRDSHVEANRLRDTRDLVVWYSPGNRFVGNHVEHGRYGTHFMYSHGNLVESNRYLGNVVGIFAMYSRDLAIHRNVFAESAGAAGMGLGAKESGGLDVRGNLFVGNRVGIYLDTSPLDPRDRNHFEANQLRFSEAALVFHGGARGNRFVGNDFRDDLVVARVEGRADALEADFFGNHFDDYAGFDLDRDGVGDLPYEARSFAEELTDRTPVLAFFRGAPALGLVELVGRVAPLFPARTLLRDPAPRMSPPPLEGMPGAG